MAQTSKPQSPGSLAKTLLAQNRLTQTDLAMITGLSRQTISSIIAGRSGITPEVATVLASAFANDPAEWLRLDNEYRLAQVQSDKQAIEHRAAIMRIAPIRDMQRRGWIQHTTNFDELEGELKRFFDTDDLRQQSEFQVAYRRNPESSYNNAVRAWCFRAKQMAQTLPVGKYYKRNLKKLESELRRVAAFAKETYRVPLLFAQYGIRFVVIEPLPKTRIDGAAFWLDEASPVIAVSIRFDRIDNFWFTVLHELKHIQHQDTLSIDDGLKEIIESSDAELGDIEKRANREAAASLIDPEELDSFTRRFGPLYSEQRIIQFAHRLRIHPGIIVGQLQNGKHISYSTLRKLLAKVRDTALETALADGWGRALPVGL